MKKIFTAPSVNFMQVEMEDNILGASNIVTDTNAQSNFEPDGTGNGNGLARQNNTTNASNPINVEALDF